MKNKIDRMKTPAMHLSKRTVALILSVIMLVSSIATGSMLNTFAAYIKDNAAKTDAIADAASEGSAIAESAIPSEDADAPAQADDADEKPDLSGFEETAAIKRFKDDLADTGAKVDLANTGFGTDKWFYVKGAWNNWAGDWVEPNTEYEIDLTKSSAGAEVEFSINIDQDGTKYYFNNGTVLNTETGKNYTWNNMNTGNNKFHVVNPCKIKVKLTWEGGGSSCKLNIVSVTESSTETKWYLIGGTAWGNWSTSNTSYPLTKNATSTFYEKEITIDSTKYFRVHNGSKEYNIGNTDQKLVTTDFQDLAENTASAAMKLDAGSYVLQVKDTGSTKQIRATSVTKYTLAVPTVDWAEVTVSYGGKTAGEGKTLTDIPAGASVSISILPDIGKSCTAVSSVPSGATITGSDHNWTLTMPAKNITSLTFTSGTVATKKVYFNNGNTLYSMVSAYVKYSNGVEPLGPFPGKTMTKGSNSNIWSIEVPGDVNYITFIGDDGVTTNDTAKYPNNPDGMMTIPWTNTNPKYTAPYNHNGKPTETNGGTWGSYTARTNEYNVTDGKTLDGSNLFKGISATFYDYYVDNEVSSSGDGDSKWITGITAERDYKCEGQNTNDPFRKNLNKALSDYATTRNITYPLYFGNNKTANATQGGVTLKNFDQRANNADGLNPAMTSIYGLAGGTLANSAIRHYSSGTNNNGVPMAYFDEDFLSGENTVNKTLATILRSSSFPVRKENVKTIYYNVSSVTGWESDGGSIFAYFWQSGKPEVREAGTNDNGVFSFNVPSGYTNVLFYRSNNLYGGMWNQSDDRIITSNVNLYTATGGSISNDSMKVKTTGKKSGTTANSNHVYYEYDSTSGRDNAFITDIDKSGKSAELNYYANSSQYVKSEAGHDHTGFFPFDYNNLLGVSYDVTKVYLKPNSNWATRANNKDPRFSAYFFVGNEYKWVSMSKVDGKDYYECTIPTDKAYTNVIFCRMNNGNSNNNWDNRWDQTTSLTIPSDDKVLFTIPGDSWGGDSGCGSDNDWSNGGITVKKGSTYADTTNHYAHDLGFGVKLTIPFTLNKNGLNSDGTAQTFDFSGDDDLWVYIDNKLILDLGGAHDATAGTINFNSKTAIANMTAAVASGNGATKRTTFDIDTTDNGVNTVHTMTIYYMERGMFDSNLKFGFSFHAVPELLQVDKKVRTANINQGFFIANATTGAVDGSGNPIKNDKDKQITKFEYSYQADAKQEPFTITNIGTPKSGSTVKYTIDSTAYTASSGSNFDYTLYNDQVAYFSEQYTSGTSVTLKETIPSASKYHYDQSFSLVDLAHNNADYAFTVNATDGYEFIPPTSSGTGLDDIRLRARFTNQMKSHDLFVSKDVNDDNTTEEFTLNIKFKLGTDNYLAYPVYGTLDGEKAQLDDNGNITIKPGQVLRLTNIPENALVQITEAAETDSSEYLYKDVTLSAQGLNKAAVDHGVTFTMGTDDVYATVQNVKYKYSFTYQYPSYDNLHGNQSYTIEDVITKEDMNTYFTLTSNNLTFKDDNSKVTFLNNKAPYENNFMDDLTLDTSVAQTEYDATNYIIKTKADKPAKFVTNPNKLSVTLKLPYAVNSDSNLTPMNPDKEGYAPYVDSPAISMKDKFSFLDWLTVNGSGVAGGTENPQFVTAPLVLTTGNANKAYKFLYWSVKSAGNSINHDSVEYTRCYSKEFNYVIFQDIILEAVYKETTLADAIAAERAYDPVARQTTAGDDVTITFIENSRNQYNNFGAGSLSTNKKRNIAGDRMYSDFLLSFNNALGETEVMNKRTDGTKCGVIIQAVGDLTFNGSSGYVTDLSKYTTLGSLATDTDLKTALENFVSEGTSGGKVNGITTAKSEFNVTELDSKNRIEFYYGLANKRDNTLDELANSKKLYRAFAYIKSGNTIKISDKPAYFTIFDMANIKVWGR